jgi:hypothetical protein
VDDFADRVEALLAKKDSCLAGTGLRLNPRMGWDPAKCERR